LPSKSFADNRAADSLQLVQNKIEAYAGLLYGFKIEAHSGLFNLVVQFVQLKPLLTGQREVVAILSGKVAMVVKIDGDFFQYSGLEMWAQKARLIVFHYHAFTLYISLLVEAQSVAIEAVKACQLWSNSVQGIAFNDPSY